MNITWFHRGKIGKYPVGKRPVFPMKISIVFVALVFLILVVLWQIPLVKVKAQDDADEEVLKVTAAIPREFPPYHSVDENGNPIGFAIDVFDHLASRAGLDVTYIIYDGWPEIQQAIRSGEADVIPNFGVTDERKELVSFTSSYEVFPVSLFVRESSYDIAGLEDIANRETAVVVSNVAVALLESAGVPIIVYDDVASAFFALLAGEVDALAYPEPIILKMAREANLVSEIKVVGNPLIEIRRSIAVAKDKPDLLHLLDEAISEFIGTDQYQEIYSKWFGEEETVHYWTAERAFWVMGILMGLSVIGMVAWRYWGLFSMNRKLRLSITERQRAEYAVQQELKVRIQAEEEISRLNRELEKRVIDRTFQLEVANRELESFSYSVSHDLRAPLRAISGFAEIIARRHKSGLNEEGQHYFDNIVSASEQMGQLIDDLLRYSRLGRQTVTLEPVPLQEILAQAVESLTPRVTADKAVLSLAEDLPVVSGDRTLLNQIFINLLDNALAYHRKDTPPQVSLDWQSEGDHVVLRVTDNGIGIAPEYHQKIFDVFQRLHSQDEYPGTGIGLAIVKKAVDMLGGRVWVESKVGGGSTFYVEVST